MQLYYIWLNIKAPNANVQFTATLYADSLGDAARHAEKEFPGALFHDGWELRSASARSSRADTAESFHATRQRLSRENYITWTTR